MRPERLALLAGACFVLAAAACSGGRGDLPLEGKVRRDGLGFEGARVEVYLAAGRFQKTEPFAATLSETGGTFRFSLPQGRYYLAARGQDAEGNRLFGEYRGNPVEVRGAGGGDGIGIDLEAASGTREYRGPADSGITGLVTSGSRPAAGAYVYVYEDDRTGLTGPGYLTAGRLGGDGRFRINLRPGRYWVAARLKAGGEKAGFVGAGDRSGVHAGNPVDVRQGEFTDLGELPLHPADAARSADVARGRTGGGMGLSGTVRDSRGAAVSGLSVLLYDNPQMIGRPLAAGVTDGRGEYRLPVPRAGRYFLGARQRRSGPRQPGEMAGSYQGTADRSLNVGEGQWLPGLDITVEEVW